MGCGCKQTGKGIPNRAGEKWLIKEIYDHYKTEIGNTTIQYFTKEQRQLVIDWYEWVYHNSKPVDYKTANNKLNYLFEYHKIN